MDTQVQLDGFCLRWIGRSADDINKSGFAATCSIELGELDPPIPVLR